MKFEAAKYSIAPSGDRAIAEGLAAVAAHAGPPFPMLVVAPFPSAVHTVPGAEAAHAVNAVVEGFGVMDFVGVKEGVGE